MSNNQQPVNSTNSFKKGPRVKPEPVYDEFQKSLAKTIMEQVTTFIDADRDQMSVPERREVERNLFSMPSFPATLDGFDNVQLYMVDRSVRTDRETHELMRATCSIVCENEHGIAYFATAFLTGHLTGSIAVCPIADGPVYINTYRINIKDGKANG